MDLNSNLSLEGADLGLSLDSEDAGTPPVGKTESGEVESFCPASQEEEIMSKNVVGLQETPNPLIGPLPGLGALSYSQGAGVGLASRASKSQLMAGRRIQDLKRGVPIQRRKVSFGPVEILEKKKGAHLEGQGLRTSDLSDASCNVMGTKPSASCGMARNCAKKKKPPLFPHSVHETGESSGVRSIKLPRSFKPPKRKKAPSISRRKSPKKKLEAHRSSGSIDSAINNSISDSNIKSCCRLHYRSEEDVPRRLWELGKRMGVSFEGSEEVVVNLIKELEARDRPADSTATAVDEMQGRDEGSQ
ncbi:hypothetical protein RIF29_40833 [Crotalaria pallida]|uniref:Uncharacterized protein n=1 Tax=Crotalaria pallida TaxID=3830 RepID=A0AAN9EA52_CROPI